MLENYLETLKKRATKSKAYHKHQFLGLEIAEILADRPHRSLYIKLAKEYGGEKMLGVAKDVAERSGVANRAAYFMRLVMGEAQVKTKKEKPREKPVKVVIKKEKPKKPVKSKKGLSK